MPGEAQVGQFLDRLGELQQGLARRHADAPQPDIHFGQYADFHLRGACRVGKLPRGEAVQRHRDAVWRATSVRRASLVWPMIGIGHQQVAGPAPA